jgi:hypothetical protein
MPAQAGIHDFSVSVTKANDPGAATKSWMPAFAGMTVRGRPEAEIRLFGISIIRSL